MLHTIPTLLLSLVISLKTQVHLQSFAGLRYFFTVMSDHIVNSRKRVKSALCELHTVYCLSMFQSQDRHQDEGQGKPLAHIS